MKVTFILFLKLQYLKQNTSVLIPGKTFVFLKYVPVAQYKSRKSLFFNVLIRLSSSAVTFDLQLKYQNCLWNGNESFLFNSLKYFQQNEKVLMTGQVSGLSNMFPQTQSKMFGWFFKHINMTDCDAWSIV